MKRIGNLWDQVISFENLFLAYRKARRGKRSQQAVERFEFKRETELARLQQELADGSYKPGSYRTFMLYDTKARMISAAPFRDRIVHHALCNVIEPIFERCFIHDSYASRAGKGTHTAIRRYQSFAQKNSWVLKCDVRQFFPSVDHEILCQQVARKIKDPHVLYLVRQLVEHSNPQSPVPGYFAGDTLFTSIERRRGLPIGNQTSQFFGNVYLNDLDHFVKEQLRCQAYLRYVDDFVLLSNDQKTLVEWRDAIEAFLGGLRLWLHPRKRVISRTRDGIRLLGFRVWPDHVWFTRDSIQRVRKRFRRYQQQVGRGELSFTDVSQRIHSWNGHAQMISGVQYRSDILSDIVFGRKVTETVRPRWLLEQQRKELPLIEPQQQRQPQ